MQARDYHRRLYTDLLYVFASVGFRTIELFHLTYSLDEQNYLASARVK